MLVLVRGNMRVRVTVGSGAVAVGVLVDQVHAEHEVGVGEKSFTGRSGPIRSSSPKNDARRRDAAEGARSCVSRMRVRPPGAVPKNFDRADWLRGSRPGSGLVEKQNRGATTRPRPANSLLFAGARVFGRGGKARDIEQRERVLDAPRDFIARERPIESGRMQAPPIPWAEQLRIEF